MVVKKEAHYGRGRDATGPMRRVIEGGQTKTKRKILASGFTMSRGRGFTGRGGSRGGGRGGFHQRDAGPPDQVLGLFSFSGLEAFTHPFLVTQNLDLLYMP